VCVRVRVRVRARVRVCTFFTPTSLHVFFTDGH